jgi:chromosome segregation ATPase
LNSSHQENKKNVAKSLEKWVNTGSKNNLKNLYQNIGTRVSKLREVNDVYQKKIKGQKDEMTKLDEEIKKKEELLNEIREAKAKNNSEYFKNLKKEGKVKLTMDITINHIKNDPELNKIIKKYENQCGELKNKLNSLHNNTESIRKNIDTLRLENLKLNQNLQDLV